MKLSRYHPEFSMFTMVEPFRLIVTVEHPARRVAASAAIAAALM
jgi:hypothetical protein